LIREVNLAVEVLKAGSLAKSKELVVDEAILDVVELVDVLHNCLTLILDKMLDKGISTNGNPKSNVAVNYKGCGRKQGTEVREGGVGCKHAQGGSVRVGRRDTLDEKLGLRLLRAVEIEGEASVFELEYVLQVREHLKGDRQLYRERRFCLLMRTRHGHLQDQKTLGSRLGSLY